MCVKQFSAVGLFTIATRHFIYIIAVSIFLLYFLLLIIEKMLQDKNLRHTHDEQIIFLLSVNFLLKAYVVNF